MAEEAKVAPAEESKPPAPAPAEAAAPKTEEAKEATVGEVLESKEAKPEPKMVPEAVFLEMKRENKKLAKDVEKLTKSIEEGATKKEVTADIKALAEKYDVGEDFLSDLAKTVRAQAETEFEDKFASKLKPIEEKERAKEIDKAFTAHFTKAMEKMPEFEGIANKDVIKSLSLLPENKNKTFTQIIEESYGHLVQGKRSIDAASTRAGKNDSNEVDTDRARKDPAYFREIMANPAQKKKYNEALHTRLASQL